MPRPRSSSPLPARGWSAPGWLLAAVLAGCATTGAAHTPQQECEGGTAAACAQFAEARLGVGDEPAAEEAWARACALGDSPSCLVLGKRRFARGELEAAEPLLVRAAEDETAEASIALAEFYEKRGAAADAVNAAEQRAAAMAEDKPDFEGVFHFRFAQTGGFGGAFTLSIQPMLFWSRRLNAGFVGAIGAGLPEANGFFGVQLFANDVVAGYARVLVGVIGNAKPNESLNYGGEAGVKLCWGEVGHVELAVGSSRASPFHASVGLGINGLYLLVLLLH